MITRTFRLLMLFGFVFTTFGSAFLYRITSTTYATESSGSQMVTLTTDVLGGCKRHTPEDGSSSCCMSGWVWEDGQPVAAEVQIVSPAGAMTVFAQSYAGSGTAPYYTVDLSTAPLNVKVGDTIDLRARHNGKEQRLTYTVRTVGQQIDLVLPRATEPADGNAPPHATIVYALEQNSGAYTLHGIGQTSVQGREITAYRWTDGSGAALGRTATLTLTAAQLPPSVHFQVQDSRGQWSQRDTLAVGGPARATDQIAFTSTRDGNNEIYVMNADGTNVIRLTNHPAYDVGPVWSPDGSKIAFVSNRDGDEEIYVMQSDGTNVTRLTYNPGPDWVSSWSPDGRKLLFETHRDGNAEIYVMAPDGSGQTNLTRNPAGDWNPSWAPDGQKIAFVSGRTGNAEIYVMNADGSGVTNLTNTTGESEWLPEWSPDGKSIAFISTGKSDGDLAVMNADGSGRFLLTASAAKDEKPTWSPDGTRIAFMTNRHGHLEIYQINIDGSGLTNLTNNPAEDWKPAWKPVVSVRPVGKMVFSSNRDGNFDIYVMDVDGTGLTRLTNNPAPDEQPVWSPDGRRVAFVSQRDGNREIYVMNADGSGQTRLTNNPNDDYWPNWSPDGRKIVFDSARNGGWDIYTMNPDGTNVTRLTANPQGNGGAAWSFDGTRIAFHCRYDGHLDICVMNADGSGQTRLTNTSNDEWLPAWSPDGTQLVFESYRDGNAEIYRMNVDGSGQTRLTSNPGWDGMPFWAQDGRFILFASDRNGVRDIYAMLPNGLGVTNITRHPASDQKPHLLSVSTPPRPITTLLITNRQRLASYYNDTAAQQVGTKLDELANHARVNGLVVPVEEDLAVAAAYAAWNNPNNAVQANAVATAIKQVIEDKLKAHPDIEYIVIVGDDRVIPFRRTVDLTYYPDPHTLTDDFYTDRVPTAHHGRELYIPDLASGRLVETPAQIIGQIDAFLANDRMPMNTGISVGYDFVKDGAQAHCTAMKADGLTADCSLIGDTWSANDYRRSVLGTRIDMVSSNVHASYHTYGTPQGSVSASDFSNSLLDLSRSLFYSVGCHSGHNVSHALDLPEAIAGIKKASYIGNTGFGWGGVGIILSEELMWRLTQQVLVGSETTPGRALVLAKQQYYADHPNPDPYDEKITTESTLYGLPMYQMTSPGATLRSTEPVATQHTDIQLTADLRKVSRDHTIRIPQPITTPDGQIYILPDGIVTSGHQEPVQPGFAVDVRSGETFAHGAVFTGGSYAVETIDPVIQNVLTTSMTLALPEPDFSSPGWYPSIFVDFNRVALAKETLERVVSTVGQYNPNRTTDNQRIFTSMKIDTFYSANTQDWDGPTVSLTHNTLNGNLAQVTVEADDPAGVHAVIVAYTDGRGEWYSTALSAGQGRTWSGSFAATAVTEFFLQAVDRVGNVTYQDNNGTYFHPGHGHDPDPDPEPRDVDLSGYDYEFYLDPPIAWAGEEAQLWLKVHRTGGKNTLPNATVRFRRDHATSGTILGTSTTPPLSPPVSADNTMPVGITFAEPGVYTVFAIIDPDNAIAETDETNNRIQRTITVLPPRIHADRKVPVITDMRINNGAAETTSRQVNVQISATDQQPDPSGVKAVYVVEYEYYQTSRQWVPTHVSREWLPYTSTPAIYPWQLESAPGMRYMYAWAIDHANNISISHGRALINYEPERDRVAKDNTRIYRYHVAEGESLVVDLEVMNGDADLYIWSSNESASAWVSNRSEGNEQVTIPTGEIVPGIYQIEVFGFSDADYRLHIRTHPADRQTSVASQGGGISDEKAVPIAPVVPVSSVPEGKLWNPPQPPFVAEPRADHAVYLPLIIR